MTYQPNPSPAENPAAEAEIVVRIIADYREAVEARDDRRAVEIKKYAMAHFPRNEQAQKELRYFYSESAGRAMRELDQYAPRVLKESSFMTEQRKQKVREEVAAAQVTEGQTYASPSNVTLIYRLPDGSRGTQPLSEVKTFGILGDTSTNTPYELVAFTHGSDSAVHAAECATLLYSNDDASEIFRYPLARLWIDGQALYVDSGQTVPVAGLEYREGDVE